MNAIPCSDSSCYLSSTNAFPSSLEENGIFLIDSIFLNILLMFSENVYVIWLVICLAT